MTAFYSSHSSAAIQADVDFSVVPGDHGELPLRSVLINLDWRLEQEVLVRTTSVFTKYWPYQELTCLPPVSRSGCYCGVPSSSRAGKTAEII